MKTETRELHQPARERDSFATTQWGLVLAAGVSASVDANTALSVLCQSYWPPLYAFVRRLGFDETQARDLTQGFFEQFLARNQWSRADPGRGRFRSFLLKSLQHYLANEQRKANRLKRGGEFQLVSLDGTAEALDCSEPCHHLTPDLLYDRRWAMTVITAALRRVRSEYAAAGQAQTYAELEGTLTGASGGISLAEIARRLRVTEGAVKVAAYRLRKRFGCALREVIADTVATHEEVDDELRHLQSVLREGLTTIGPASLP